MLPPKCSKISILLSAFLLLLLVYINIKTAILYYNSQGKNRALFGLIEMVNFGYKYWLLIPALLAMILGLVDLRKVITKTTVFATSFAILVIGLIFVRFWVIFT